MRGRADRARVGGSGQLAITLKPHRGQMYQGIVASKTDSVARAVERYFETSEQLPTRIWATATSTHGAVGMLLQRMPDPQHARPPRSWIRREPRGNAFRCSADTVTDQELLDAVGRALLLVRLFQRRIGPRCSRRSTSSSVARARENAPRTCCESSGAPKSTTSSRRKVGSRSRASSAAQNYRLRPDRRATVVRTARRWVRRTHPQ